MADIICTIVIFIFSMIKNNSSVYDPLERYPSIYCLFMDETIKYFNLYAIIILALYLMWGIRLTLNWFINWRGFSHEDWRYVSFREKVVNFIG